MGSDLSVLLIAIVLAGVVTLLVELLRLPITKRTIMIISTPVVGVLVLMILLSTFFSSDENGTGQEMLIPDHVAEERQAIMADINKEVDKGLRSIRPVASTVNLVAEAIKNTEVDIVERQELAETSIPEILVQEETSATTTVPDTAAKSEEEINSFLEFWQEAWEKSAGENGDIAAFGEFYAAGFRSGNLDRSAWLAKKARTNRKKTWIKVELADIKIVAEGDIVKVSFQQEYSSSNYAEKTAKTLGLQKTDGAWKIVLVE